MSLRFYERTLNRKEALDGFQHDTDAQCHEENTVDECAQDLCPLPSIRVGSSRRGCRELDGVESDNEGDDIAV